MNLSIQHSIFAVATEPYCVWGWDLEKRNVDFIQQIDPDYFEYVCKTHLEHIEDDHSQHAAIAIRSNYYLALETFFGLIAATLQAPDCLAGWILRSSTADLRLVTTALLNSRMDLPVKWHPVPRTFSFENAAQLVFQNSIWGSETDGATARNFGKLWQRLAHDFLDSYSIKEYNSIKHGFRARSGGFVLRAGIESQPGVPCPPEAMKTLGGSKFGSSFYSAEPIGDAKKFRNDPNFALRHNGFNWSAESTAGRLLFAAMSIRNIKSFLEIHTGTAPQTVKFHRLESTADFESPWNESPGVTSMNIDLMVAEQDIRRFKRTELNNILAKNVDSR